MNRTDSAVNRYLSARLSSQLVDLLDSKWVSRTVSLGLCIVAGLLVWSLLPHKARADLADANTSVVKAQPDTRTIAELVARAHLFGQSPNDAASIGPAANVTANVTLEGILYSPDPEFARAILDVDGKGDVYKKGDSLPDGEKLAEIGIMAVHLATGGATRELAFSQESSGPANGIQLASAGNLNPDLFPGSEPLSTSGLGSSSRLQSVYIPTGRDPIAKMQALRQQLIKH